eukprot:TRINITY_DN3585_c0_g3_i1.p4 TRINITY_DN3585_c0_g3~~TRINITY_DN3585_c0_g3_i1.p4  ORF type:complete len:110 (-),score=16.16 TRINITY_DN3585_c0_g3_i1:10-339(-)
MQQRIVCCRSAHSPSHFFDEEENSSTTASTDTTSRVIPAFRGAPLFSRACDAHPATNARTAIIPCMPDGDTVAEDRPDAKEVMRTAAAGCAVFGSSFVSTAGVAVGAVV